MTTNPTTTPIIAELRALYEKELERNHAFLEHRAGSSERKYDEWFERAIAAEKRVAELEVEINRLRACIKTDREFFLIEKEDRIAAEAREAKLREALELAGDFIQREVDLRSESALDEQDEYIAEPQRISDAIRAALKESEGGK